jgi:hypothetical protein
VASVLAVDRGATSAAAQERTALAGLATLSGVTVAAPHDSTDWSPGTEHHRNSITRSGSLISTAAVRGTPTVLTPFEATRLNFMRLPADEGLSAIDDIWVPSYGQARADACKPPISRRTS